MTDQAVSTIMDRTGMEARTPGTITSVPAFLEHLDSIRARGYSLDEEENEPGIRCIGAAVYDHTGRATGAVSISTLALEPWDRPLPDLASRVRVSAKEISKPWATCPPGRRDRARRPVPSSERAAQELAGAGGQKPPNP